MDRKTKKILAMNGCLHTRSNVARLYLYLPRKEGGEKVDWITWDITIFTDKRMKHNRPDITVVHKDTQEWMIINIAAPADQNILTTGEEKYQNLALEIKRILRAKRVTILPIVTSALRTTSGYTKAGNGRLSLPDIFGSAQLSAILSTAHILRKVSC
ncbi:unnamed protein product, partial [Porites evermanni]